jgi:hypothetical protein
MLTARSQGVFSMTTDTEYWRVESVQLVTDGAALLTTAQAGERGITIAKYNTVRWAAHRAQVRGDDAALMQYLKTYCPNDPHVSGYPGPDHQTTTLP